MSEATYTGGDDPEQPTGEGAGGSGGPGGRTGASQLGGIAIDTTYPRSIEGILKLVTVVSRTTRS